MTECCEITVPDASSAVRLSAESSNAKIMFTCRNVLPRSFPGRAELIQLDAAGRESAAPAWLTFVSKYEFGKEATVSIEVTAAPAPSLFATGDKLSFKLRVSNDLAPNEEFSESRAIRVELGKQAVPVPPPRPAWLVPAILGGVVALGGVGFGIYELATKPSPAPLEPDPVQAAVGGACQINYKCPELQACDKGKNVCLGDVGFKGCKLADDCLTHSCIDGACGYPAPGHECKTPNQAPSSECPLNQHCTRVPVLVGGAQVDRTLCLLAPQQPCERGEDCTSQYCNRETHKCNRDDLRCDAESECMPGFKCSTDKRCVIPNGVACVPSAAANLLCEGGLCSPSSRTCGAAPVPCNPPCSGKMTCRDGACVDFSRWLVELGGTRVFQQAVANPELVGRPMIHFAPRPSVVVTPPR